MVTELICGVYNNYEFDGESAQLGSIIWDGTEFTIIANTDEAIPTLQKMISEPIQVNDDIIDPSDGEQFIKGLKIAFGGSYFYADEARPLVDSDLEDTVAQEDVQTLNGGPGSGIKGHKTVHDKAAAAVKVHVEDKDDWRAEGHKRNVEAEIKRLVVAHPGLAKFLTANPIPVHIAKTIHSEYEGGGLHTGDAIHLSTQFNATRRHQVGQGTHLTDESPMGTFRHELGHHISQMTRIDDGAFSSAVRHHMKEEGKDYSKSSQRKQWLADNISQYGSTNLNEAFSEAFGAFTHEKYGTKGKLPKQIEMVLQGLLKD